jgi:hypothetical protein
MNCFSWKLPWRLCSVIPSFLTNSPSENFHRRVKIPFVSSRPTASPPPH